MHTHSLLICVFILFLFGFLSETVTNHSALHPPRAAETPFFLQSLSVASALTLKVSCSPEQGPHSRRVSEQFLLHMSFLSHRALNSCPESGCAGRVCRKLRGCRAWRSQPCFAGDAVSLLVLLWCLPWFSGISRVFGEPSGTQSA